MDPRKSVVSPESALASDIFDKFCTANTLKGILSHHRLLCDTLRLKPTHFPDFFPRLRAKLCSWRANALWTKFEKRVSHKCYGRGMACYGRRVLIIGGGPCGLRTAIEAQLLGAKVVLIEKRDRFSRNNVLHLWPFVIADLKGLGAKKFYGKFCAGSIDHISIRQLQCILLKVALLLGVEVHEGVSFECIVEPVGELEGWRAITTPSDHPVSHYNFDVLFGADGRRNTLEGFKRKALRAKLAIAITANFINKHTEAEARVKEISGVSYIFNQKFFQELNEATDIDLENIVYYKDETHYFVMTAKKHSLLTKGVLLHDYADTAKLLSHENINTEALMDYAFEAAIFSTENQLPNLEFAVNHYGQPDVAMFDFTAMYAAENACRIVQRKGHKLLLGLVGDSLLEPFWPTGSGCARGFLSSFDSCWMIRSFSLDKSMLNIIAERESIYRLLGQTTPENLNKEHLGYNIDPHSRYPNLNLRVVLPFQVKNLYDTDEKDSLEEIDAGQEHVDVDYKISKKRRRDAVIGVDTLLSWLREQIVSYGLEITNVCDAFIHGDILCAIIHRFRPEIIEFPLPSEENLIDPADIAACRNQIAFDLLYEEYGLQPVMTGFESIHYNSSEFMNIVSYLSQIYEIFRGEIPQIKYPSSDGADDIEEMEQQKRSSQLYSKECSQSVLNTKYGARRSRHEGEGETSGKRRIKRRSEERGREEHERRSQDIERNRTERQKRRMQERILQTERCIKSMKLLHMNDRGGNDPNNSDDDEPYHDFTFHLYRQMAPDFEQRCKLIEKKLFYPGKDLKQHQIDQGLSDAEKQMVPGLAKHLEEKLKGSKHVDKKPKDLLRAIGKIEKSDWNVQLIEKKIAESKTHSQGKKDRDDKVPKWSREKFDDKREAMKRKMEGGDPEGSLTSNERIQIFEETVKKVGTKIKDGNTLEIGQRGSNKVSQMAEKLVHKLERKKGSDDTGVGKSTVTRPVFEFPKKGGEMCHFCKEKVYVVERMTAEDKYFHRNCFRCEYRVDQKPCNTSLRLGNYVFDREGRYYGEKFYCSPHYQVIRMKGWKKLEELKGSSEGTILLTPSNQQILSEMDERGTTPERIEFENSVDFASEEELLSEMDEDEWTDRNFFGTSNADNNTSDEASDLSDDDDITPEGKNAINKVFPPENYLINTPFLNKEDLNKKKETASSDSDTDTIGSGEESQYDSNEDDDDEDEDADEEELEEEEEEEEGGEGSTTEIETDSEFAEDPPEMIQSVPTITIDEPEQLTTRVIEIPQLSRPHIPTIINKKSHGHGHGPTLPSSNKRHHHGQAQSKQPHEVKANDDSCLNKNYTARANEDIVQEVVYKTLPYKSMPKVNVVPKQWDNWEIKRNQDVLACKMSLELKKKYLHGPIGNSGVSSKKSVDTLAQNKFTHVLDMISEKQKLLQPISKPSAAMQAILEGNEKFKNRTNNISPITENHVHSVENITTIDSSTEINSPFLQSQEFLWGANDSSQEISIKEKNNHDVENEIKSMNKINLQKSGLVVQEEKSDIEKEISLLNNENESGVPQIELLVGSTASFSNSETESQSTVIDINNILSNSTALDSVGQTTCSESGSDTEGAISEDVDDDDDDQQDQLLFQGEPPRVEIEDEFGVTLALDYDRNKLIKNHENEKKLSKDLQHDTSGSGKHCENEEHHSKLSSSESKESLNSGVFLETEISDWEGDRYDLDDQTFIKQSKLLASGNDKINNQRQNDSSSVTKNNNNDHLKNATTNKENLKLEFEKMDFMDTDGLSSPENILGNKNEHQKRYCKLASDDEDFIIDDNSCNPEATNRFICSHKPGEVSSSSTPTPTPTPTVTDFKNESNHRIVHNQDDFSAAVPEIDLDLDVTRSENEDPVGGDELKEQLYLEGNQKLSQNEHSKAKLEEKYPIFDRVVPFYNARDSLDYRKMKGVSSPIKSKDLFSSYGELKSNNEHQYEEKVPPVPTLPPPLEEDEKEMMKYVKVHKEKSGRAKLKFPENVTSDLEKSGNNNSSPNTVRRLDEINKERAKQNDLIKAMVMGRIRKSPEKSSRRGSRGSLSPFDATSPYGSSELVMNDNFTPIEGSGISEESRRNLDLSNSLENNVLEKSNNNYDATTTPSYNNQLVKPTSVKINKQQSEHYEPVFTSSPRFRNRPKFDSSLKSQVCSPVSEIHQQQQSLFYRSMPDITKIFKGTSSPRRNIYEDVRASNTDTLKEFSKNNLKQQHRWEEMGRNSSSIKDREKAREIAREKARLRSDKEFGLKDYSPYKEKLKRKESMADPDLEEEDLSTTSISSNSSSAAFQHQLSINPKSDTSTTSSSAPGGDGKNRPQSDLFDSVASLIRYNVDFPINKNFNSATNSPSEKSSPIHMPSNIVSSSSNEQNQQQSLSLSQMELNKSLKYENQHHQKEKYNNQKDDNFSTVQLRFSSRDSPSERKLSPEKSKSVGLDYNQPTSSFPSYFSSPSKDNQYSQVNSNNWVLEKVNPSSVSPPTVTVRPRSNTFSELGLGPFFLPGKNSPSYLQQPQHHYSSTAGTSNSPLTSITNKLHSPLQSQSQSQASKFKARSSDTLLEDSSISVVPDSFLNLGQSVPDLKERNVPGGDEKTGEVRRKSKDRDRRKSIIQTISDIFTKITPEKSPTHDRDTPSSSSPSNSSASGLPQPFSSTKEKERFSLFKLTPKMLSKDKRKSNQNITTSQPMINIKKTSEMDKSKLQQMQSPPKPPRSKIISYLSQPELVLQRLSSSPVPHKANVLTDFNQLNQNQRFIGPGSQSSPSNRSIPQITETRRMRELHEIQIQLDSIDAEKDRLESRGIIIERKLRGEEQPGTENQDEILEEDATLLEEWFTLVREKTRLSRFEKELQVRKDELELDEKMEQIEEELDRSFLIDDAAKDQSDMQRDMDLLRELKSLESKKENLLTRFHEEMKKYEDEDDELENKIAGSNVSPRESNV